MEMSEALSQQERLQAIAEKRKKQTEIENKKRVLEDDRRQLQHLKSKALRERWLLDGAPSAGSEVDEAKKQLQEDEAKTKELEDTVTQLEQELEELETGVSATSTKENLSESVKEEETETADNKDVVDTGKEVKVHLSPCLEEKFGGDSDMMRTAMYSVEITVERDRLTGETKVLSTSTLLPKDLSHQGVKVYEDAQKVVHEVRGVDGAMETGAHQLSASEVDELILKADEVTMSVAGGTPRVEVVAAEQAAEGAQMPKVEITGTEAKPSSGQAGVGVGEASAEHPVTMVFMGYQSVEDEAETKKVLGLEGTVKAELVVIEDGESKAAPAEAKEGQAPPNGSTAEPATAGGEAVGGEGGEKGEPKAAAAAELNNKEKQPCKCCSIM